MDTTLSPLTQFKKQFDFKPTVSHGDRLIEHRHTVIAGMGGSAICVNLLKMLFPELSLSLHNSYGLPASFDTKNTLLIVNSYSGNTEEELDTLARGMKDGASVALLSEGGELLKKGEEHSIPYITIPESDLEPRFSIGYQLIGLLTLMGEHEKIRVLREKVSYASIEKADVEGKRLATSLFGTYPVLYASSQFFPIAYLIKAAINEGAKIPSFVSIIPEANHNELQSFVTDEYKDEHERFSFLFLTSTFDHQRIERRFEIMQTLYSERHFTVETITKDATNITEVFEVILTGYFLATYLALGKGADPYKTPFIQKFKKTLSN